MNAKSIVVVDDDEALVFMMKENLEAEGYRVRTGYDGAAALRLVQESVPDLIILDLNMPGWNGVQALAQFRADPKTAQLPVILLTGEASDRVLPKGGDAKAICISKPVELDQINALIGKFLQ